MYTEKEMSRRFQRVRFSAFVHGGVDVLVTHAPAKGYGDLDDLPPRGFETFNRIITKYRPAYMLHGHIHKSYGRIKSEYTHKAGTKIINVCGYKIIDV